MKSLSFKEWKAAWIATLNPGDVFQTRRPAKDNHCRLKEGDTIYIKEPWCTLRIHDGTKPSELPDDAFVFYGLPDYRILYYEGRPRNAMFLPTRFARSWATVKSIRKENVQDVTVGDAIKEGIRHYISDGTLCSSNPVEVAVYRDIWESIYSKIPALGWESNPLVWVIELEKTEKP